MIETRPRTLLTITSAALFITTCLLLCSGCGGEHVRDDGVIVAYGNTQLSIEEAPEQPAPAANYRDATSEDVVAIMVALGCTYPSGATSIERRSLISRQMQDRSIDPDSFQGVYNETIKSPIFAEKLAQGMYKRCPDELEAMLSASR